MNEYFCIIENRIKKNHIPAFKSFLKWVVIGIAMGVLLGIIGTLFYYGIESAAYFRNRHTYIIWLLPLSGAVIVYFYNAMGYRHDKGTNLVLLAVRDNKKMGYKHTICIFVASIITHLFGGSSGREGAALQIGGSIGSQLGRVMNLDDDDKRILTMCGISAAFSSIFCTPVTAAFFAMEVVSIGIFYYSAIVPCVISAITAQCVSEYFGVRGFELTVHVPEFGVLNFSKILLLSVLCAGLSYVFCTTMKYASILYKKIKNQTLRAMTGGFIVSVLTFAIGSFDYNGTGGNIITDAFSEPSKPYAFILKLIFTALTLCAGFKGGEIVPVFFIGATFGSVFAEFTSMDCSIGAAVGMIALFCGVTNCPIASLLMSLELFGSNGIIYYAIACAVGYMLSGYQGLYAEQKIVYSKFKTRFINRKTGSRPSDDSTTKYIS